MPVGDARQIMESAARAEQHGWDGIFVWEPLWGVDAWVSMTAAALATSSIKVGTLLSPLSRMRPWQVAAKSATLDHLSGGRLILSVGLGATDTGFESFGEVTDIRRRAELLDESLAIVTGLWRGQPFTYAGKHYRIGESTFPHKPPVPVNDARVPIWVVGLWPNRRSMARAMKYQGIIASVRNERGEPGHLKPADVRAIRELPAPESTSLSRERVKRRTASANGRTQAPPGTSNRSGRNSSPTISRSASMRVSRTVRLRSLPCCRRREPTFNLRNLRVQWGRESACDRR